MAYTIIEASRLMWCPGLSQMSGRPNETIQGWLAKANYAPSAIDKNIVLSGIDRRFFLEALGTDINRVASAASETLKNIVEIKNLPKSLAWPYVKMYYSSLFYAHVILRIWGRSPSYLRTSDLIILRNTLLAYGVSAPYKLQTGQYLITSGSNASFVELQADNGGGGSHEAVWREFYRALSDLKIAVNNGPYLSDDKIEINRQLDAFTSLLSENGRNMSWPSQMRNNIQYRQAEGVWYPYQGKAKCGDLYNYIEEIISGDVNFSKIISTNGSDLTRFRSACVAIIFLARGVLADMSVIGGAKSFLRYGQRRFEDAILS